MQRYCLAIGIGIIVSLVAGALSPDHSFAAGSWTSGTFVFGEKQVAVDTQQGCKIQNVRIGANLISSKTANVCVYERNNWRYGTYMEVSGPPYAPSYMSYLVIGVGLDSGMYKVSNLSPNYSIDTPGTNDLIFNYLTAGFSNNHVLKIIHNVPSKLSHTIVNGEIMYELKPNSMQTLIEDKDGNPVTTGAIGVSENGRWLGIEIMNLGFITVDTTTNEMRLFSNYRHVYGVGRDAHITFVISNSGRYVATFDYNITPKIYALSDQCVLRGSSYEVIAAEAQGYQPCPDDGSRLLEVLQRKFGSGSRSMAAHSFNYDADTLYFDEYDADTVYELPLHAGDYNPSAQLEYLALGDSYSSGEGDTDGWLRGQNHYQKGTNEEGPPEEKCHISTRSYPYLLAAMQLTKADRWQTIACSGAKVQQDYYGSDEGYLGQGSRLSYFKEKTMIQNYKQSSLVSFTPGRDKQIEFVKRYKPHSITITGSGNDAGFSNIIKACVSPGNSENTCDYANASQNINMLAKAIRQQYDHIRSLVYALKEASPNTVIYYVGYPQFIASNSDGCGGSVALSHKERSVFRDGVVYLNAIIKAAAESEKAVYVDIENTLHGHELCDTEEAYVNGFNLDCSDIDIIHFFRGKSDCQESFHPRPEAHTLIAQAIDRQISLKAALSCGKQNCLDEETPLSDVSIPKVFQDALTNQFNANYVPTTNGTMLSTQKGNTNGNISVEVPSLEPNSQAHVYMASNPTEIGNFAVDTNGTLQLNFAVPQSISAGFHTLHAEAQTNSGEPVDIWWIVRVIGAKGDIDEDGIPDDQDACQFMPALNVDRDHDGIDDGCDPIIAIQSSDGTISPSDRIIMTRTGNYISSTFSGASFDVNSANEEVNLNALNDEHKSPSRSNPQPELNLRKTPGAIAMVTAVVVTMVVILVMLKLIQHYHAKKQ